MPGVVPPGRDRLLASFAQVARYYGAAVDVCPPRRARRKGAVEKQNDFSTQRWWRTARVENLAEAQRAYDRFQQGIGDRRRRGRQTVADVATAEELLPLPAQPYPATVEVVTDVDRSALVDFQGNRYSVMPGLLGAQVVVRHRLGSGQLTIQALNGLLLATHRQHPPGAGVIERLPEHRLALEAAVLSAFTTATPCRRKANRPPGPEATAAAAALTGLAGSEVSIDLSGYAELAEVVA
jgi:hypothetical protein